MHFGVIASGNVSFDEGRLHKSDYLIIGSQI